MREIKNGKVFFRCTKVTFKNTISNLNYFKDVKNHQNEQTIFDEETLINKIYDNTYNECHQICY